MVATPHNHTPIDTPTNRLEVNDDIVLLHDLLDVRGGCNVSIILCWQLEGKGHCRGQQVLWNKETQCNTLILHHPPHLYLPPTTPYLIFHPPTKPHPYSPPTHHTSPLFSTHPPHLTLILHPPHLTLILHPPHLTLILHPPHLTLILHPPHLTLIFLRATSKLSACPVMET